MRHFKYLAMAMIFILVSCSSSKITSTWKAKNIQPKNYDKILVLGLLTETDRSIREKIEHHLLAELLESGYNAVCACEEFSPKEFEKMSEEQALNKLSGSGIDGVLTVVLLDKSREKYYVPAYVDYSPYGMYRNNFWGYYNTMHHRIYSPGYYDIQTKFFWESNFYDMHGKQLLYSVQTQSFDPSSAEKMAHEYGELIVNDIVKSDVLSKRVVKEGEFKPF